MSISIKKWARVDHLAEPIYRAFHLVIQRGTSVNDENSGDVVVIKLFGLGSIVRLMDMCEDACVDISSITIVTSRSHEELCNLWGLKAIFIDTSSAWTLARTCLKAVRAVSAARPGMIVDFERCSNLVGIFRTIMAWRAGCKTLSFEQRQLDSVKSVIKSVDQLSQQQIFLEGIKYFSSVEKTRRVIAVAVDAGKIIVNVNASDLLESRKYNLSSFATAIRYIYSQYPTARFYLSGVKNEKKNVELLADMLTGLPVQNVAGEWTLGRLMSELTDCELLITGDSAPLHLGKYLNVPTLSIWGPTQPEHFGYSAAGFETVTLAMQCSPCFLHPRSTPAIACSGAITCMKQIQPETVGSRALKILSRTQTTRDITIPVNLHLQAAQSVNVEQ